MESSDGTGDSSRVEWGDRSPFSVDYLRSCSFQEVVELVSTWKVETDTFTGPNREGLRQVFQEYIGTDPVDYSMYAHLLIDRPPVFVHAFINAMKEAVNSEQILDFKAIFKLCSWILKQPIGEGPLEESYGDD